MLIRRPDMDSSPDLTFRLAGPGDLNEIVRMLADDPLGAQRETYSEPLVSGYCNAFEAIRSDPNNELIVAVHGNSIVAVLQLTFIPNLTYRGHWRALIEGVRVSSGARSRGVGAALVRHAVARARARGCAIVQLTTDKARDDALRFYERLGFVSSHHGLKLHLE